MDKRITTLDELIDLVAFGDIHEANFIFANEPEETRFPVIRLPWNRDFSECCPDDTSDDRTDILAILIAFKEGRLSSGGHVLPKATPTTSENTTP